MFKISFTVDGIPIMNRAFSRIGEHLEDLRPIWNSVQKTFNHIEDTHFKSQGNGASGGWQPLTRAYAKQKAQRYGAKTILRASDRLYSSLTKQTGDTVLFKEKQEFGIGTSLPYAPYHQRGGGNLPKRPVIDFSESQKTELSKGMQRDILKELRRDGAINRAVDIT